jgi:hypothetical protein
MNDTSRETLGQFLKSKSASLKETVADVLNRIRPILNYPTIEVVEKPEEMFGIDRNAGPAYDNKAVTGFGHRSLDDYKIKPGELSHVTREIVESKWFNTRTWAKTEYSLENHTALGGKIKERRKQKLGGAIDGVIENNTIALTPGDTNLAVYFDMLRANYSIEELIMNHRIFQKTFPEDRKRLIHENSEKLLNNQDFKAAFPQEHAQVTQIIPAYVAELISSQPAYKKTLKEQGREFDLKPSVC